MVVPVLVMALFSCCQREVNESIDGLIYDTVPTAHTVTPMIQEASGIADSKANPGYLWVQEDSGTPPELILLAKDGTVKKRIYVKGAENRDWEDMALVGNTIYIGEIGDNNAVHGTYYFYLMEEPLATADTVYNVTKIAFTYPDGNHDAEAFIVDPTTKDIYIISKRDNPSIVYKLSYPYQPTQVVTKIGTLGYGGVVSAALAPDKNTILVKTYFGLNQFVRPTGKSLGDALLSQPKGISYKIEPQGEAVSFALDGSGFYTLSEKGFSNAVILYFYKKK